MTLFANGAGLYTQPLNDGTTAGPELLTPVLPVSVYDANYYYPNLLGKPQPLLYAGTAPGLVAGVLQVNFQIGPITSGVNRYVLVVGDYASQPVAIYAVLP